MERYIYLQLNVEQNHRKINFAQREPHPLTDPPPTGKGAPPGVPGTPSLKVFRQSSRGRKGNINTNSSPGVTGLRNGGSGGRAGISEGGRQFKRKPDTRGPEEFIYIWSGRYQRFLSRGDVMKTTVKREAPGNGE